MLCFRLLDEDEPASPLADAVAALRTGSMPNQLFDVEPVSFRQVPNAPFAYWVSEGIRRIFSRLPAFESEGRTVRQGLATADDFRFVRTTWETPSLAFNEANRRWFPFAKGGSYSPFYADINLEVNWGKNGSEIRYLGDPTGAKPLSRPQSVGYYFKPGLTWPLRGIKYSAQAIPAGCIFSIAGKFATAKAIDELYGLLGLFNCSSFDYLIRLFAGKVGGVQYEVGLISCVPVPPVATNDGVIINHAPLWRITPYAPWRKALKDTWDALVAEKYDWAHLALHLWPERVIPKCAEDRSLAIAHDLEPFFWANDPKTGETEPRGRRESDVQTLVTERTSPAVKSALESLLTAPAPSGGTSKRTRKTTKT